MSGAEAVGAEMAGTVAVSLRAGRPLTPMQRALWVSQRRHPAAPLQNMALLTHIEGPVDADRLAAAFASVVEACDVLRTRIVDRDGTALVTLDAEPEATDIVDVDRPVALSWAEARVGRPLDMAVRGYDSAILRHRDGTVSWYLALHHTITDATSSSLVFDLTAAAYHGTIPEAASYYRWATGLTGAASDNPAEARRARAQDHWRDRRAAPGLARLYHPVQEAGPEADRLDVDLDPELVEALRQRLDAELKLLSPDLSWTALLMTATAAYLHQVGGTDAFAIGLPVHNRGDARTRGLVGPVMEVFPVDVTVQPGDSFRSLHKRVSRAIMTTLGQAVPGTAPAGDYAAVVNVIPRAAVGPFGSLATTTRWIHSGAIDASHLLRVQLTAYQGPQPGTGVLAGRPMLALDLNRSVAGPAHLDRASGHFRAVLAAAAADPAAPAARPILGPAELDEVQVWESAADFAVEPPGLVAQLRSGLAGRTTVALREGASVWTGDELWQAGQRVARSLRRVGVGSGDRVAVEMARSAEAVIAILGILSAGASFVPLDPCQPEGRRRSLTERAGCRLVLTALPPPLEAPAGHDLAREDPGPDDEAYLLFTSGSTGDPKGVPISHRGLARYLRFAQDSYLDRHPGGGRARALVVPLFSALTFDLTMTSLFLPLVAGGELVVIGADGPQALAAVAADERLNWCKATPSHLEVLLRLLPEGHSLATVVVGGEAFGAGLARRLLAHRGDLAIFNEYGPTEAVVGCMIHRVDPAASTRQREVPIGRPAPGVTLRVVGRELQRVPLGAAGELLIAHVGLTAGYLGEPIATDGTGGTEPGTPGPFVELDGHRFYRSGDLVRLEDPTSAVYLGRIDEQVKVGGIRLEPTEVEDALVTHPAVTRAAVRLWSPSPELPSQRCARCGLASNVPGVAFDAAGVCRTCHDYERVAPQADAWFRTEDDLRAKQAEARRRRTGRYDCLHLLSGGKDSTYALYSLVQLGFEPYALTLDNGFISEGAKANIRRSVADLGIDHHFATTEAMNDIFLDSLERHSNVCHGCYKTIYTLATSRAVELGIPLIVTGLSRGQLFETRLIPQQFRAERFDPAAIDRAVLEARRTYHRIDDGPNRLLDTSVFATDDVFEQVEYLDFYRYVDVELSQMLAFLDTQAPWVRPRDTGRSTNCLINAAGIHTHLQEQGYHNYAIPYAWDVRLGHKTRQEAIDELDDQLDLAEVGRLLDTVGYTPNPRQVLTAWLEPEPGAGVPSPAELRTYLGQQLPAHAVPAAFVTVESLPLTANGKLDTKALPAPQRTHRSSTGVAVAPETEREAAVIAVWERVLRTEPISAQDDFFALGGDSLAALEMIVAVAEATGIELADELAFLHTTPRSLAAALDLAALGEPVPPGSVPDSSLVPMAPSEPVQLGPWSDQNPPPLSSGELAILYEQSRRPESVMYNVGRLYRVHGPVDAVAFGAAVRAVASLHVPLSWSYGARRHRLDPERAVSIDHSTEPVPAAQLDAALLAAHRIPFDLNQGPLLRVWIRPVDDGTTAVLLACHHVSGDAESFGRLWHQVGSHLAGQAVAQPLPDYPSFSRWQLDQVEEADGAHWRQPGPPPAPAALRAPGNPAADGFLTRAASVTVRDLRSRAGSTGFALVLAAVTAALRRYHQGDRIACAMITSSRTHPGAEPLVGYFLNTLPLELDCGLDTRLDELVPRAGAAAARNLARRHYPYSRIVADRRRDQRLEPTLAVLVAYDELPPAALGGHRVEQKVLSNGSAVTDATFFVELRPDGSGDGRVDLSLEHRGSVMGPDLARQLLDDLDAMLTAVVRQGIATVGEVELSSPGSQLTGAELVAPASLLPLILAHTTRQPGAEAVRAGGRSLSWAQLDHTSRRLAHRLRAAGVSPGDRVIVCLPRSVELVSSILAILRAGAVYVPIDPTYPADRIALVAARAGASAAVVEPGRSLTLRDLVVGSVDAVSPAPVPPTTDGDPDHDLDRAAGADGAYLIFTSGSTGLPRGVPVTHGQLAASTVARRGVYPEQPDRFLLVSSPAFDSSIVGLFWTLTEGGTVVLPTDSQAHDPDELLGLLETERVSHTLTVPTLYQALLERGRSRQRWPRRVIVAGEACPAALVERHFELRADAALTNEYGPTEASVWATAHHCRPGEDPVPIGSVIPGSWVAVVDTADRPVPHGVEGQLVIGGAGVVDGYLDEPEATAERFGTGPGGRFFRTGDRAVVDGDRLTFLGRLDHQLNLGGIRAEPEDIERVLLGEPSVGAALVTVSDPRSLDELVGTAGPEALAAAMAEAARSRDPAGELVRRLRGPSPSGARLVAHLEAAPRDPGSGLGWTGPTPPGDGSGVDLDAVRALAARQLPPLLRPSLYSVHARLPRTPNGKIDRTEARQLPVRAGAAPVGLPLPTSPVATTAAAAPGHDVLVDEVSQLFARILRLERVGPEQSFFDLGGHSLLAMELLLELESRYRVDLTVSTLYDGPSPRAVAELLGRTHLPQQFRYLVPIQPHGSRPPIFGVHVLGPNSEFYRPLAARLGDDQPLYGLGLPTLNPDTSGPTDVRDVAERYAEELERCAPTGPVTLTAVSLGSVVAFELAHQLRRRGRTVALLGLFDAAGPFVGELALTRTQRLGVHARELGAHPLVYSRARWANIGRKARRTYERVGVRTRRALGLRLSDELRVRQFVEANWASQNAYRFDPYPGSVVVFKAGDDPFTRGLAEAGMGWAPVTTGPFEVEVVPGGHLSMLAEPHVEALAPRLAAAHARALAAAARVDVHDTPPQPAATTPPPPGPASTTIGAGVGPGPAIGGATPATEGQVEASLVTALHQGTFGIEVARWLTPERQLSPAAARLVAEADRVSRTLAEISRTQGRVALEALVRAGVDAALEPVPQRLAGHRAALRLGTASAGVASVVEPARTALEQLGYQLQDRLGSRGWAELVRSRSSCTFIRRDSGTFRLDLVWRAGARRSVEATMSPSPLVEPPSAGPHASGPQASGTQAGGTQAGEPQAGETPAGRPDLGVFLGTPTGLVAGILALAEPAPEDLVVDLGCGDGRVLVEAVRRFGCRGRGVEIDPELAAAARVAVAGAGLTHRIEIVEGDASGAPVHDAGIVFMFLPPEVTGRLLPAVLDRLTSGARVVAHEQLAIQWPVAPERSRLVLGAGVTVAHLWRRA